MSASSAFLKHPGTALFDISPSTGGVVAGIEDGPVAAGRASWGGTHTTQTFVPGLISKAAEAIRFVNVAVKVVSAIVVRSVRRIPAQRTRRHVARRARSTASSRAPSRSEPEPPLAHRALPAGAA